MVTETGLGIQTVNRMCREKGIEPYRRFSGRFNVRLDPKIHQAAVVAASAENKSLNEWVAEAIEAAVHGG